MEDDKKLAWVVDEGGNVHANSEMLLLREMESTLRNDEVSSLLLSSFEDVFFGTLAESGYVPKSEYRKILCISTRLHVLSPVVLEGKMPEEIVGDTEAMSVFLADAVARSVQSLVVSARRIGGSGDPEAAAIRWAKSKLAKTKYARFVTRK